MIILDIGSGNTCKNNPAVLRQMIDEIGAIDTSQDEIVFKAQLFSSAPPNIRLSHSVFEEAYWYGARKGYAVTASVFDRESIQFLLGFSVPWIKIACRPSLYVLARDIPEHIPIIMSFDRPPEVKVRADYKLLCVPKYPADIEDYEDVEYWDGVSDHTRGLKLYRRYRPAIWEKHLKLPHSTGPDAGVFAVTPNQLRGVI